MPKHFVVYTRAYRMILWRPILFSSSILVSSHLEVSMVPPRTYLRNESGLPPAQPEGQVQLPLAQQIVEFPPQRWPVVLAAEGCFPSVHACYIAPSLAAPSVPIVCARFPPCSCASLILFQVSIDGILLESKEGEVGLRCQHSWGRVELGEEFRWVGFRK